MLMIFTFNCLSLSRQSFFQIPTFMIYLFGVMIFFFPPFFLKFYLFIYFEKLFEILLWLHVPLISNFLNRKTNESFQWKCNVSPNEWLIEYPLQKRARPIWSPIIHPEFATCAIVFCRHLIDLWLWLFTD